MIASDKVYLIISTVYFLPWLFIFVTRKDLRNQMVLMGLILGVVGIVVNYFLWSHDWWHPETITHTAVGIEDLAMGFLQGGLAAVIYEAVFRTREYKKTHIRHGAIILLLFLPLLIVDLLAWWKIPSGLGTAVSLLVVGGIIIWLRRDLWRQALLSGALMLILMLPFYYLAMWLSPGWIDATWVWIHLSGIKITGIPIEDLIFYFQAGFVAAPLYEYGLGLSMSRISSRKN